MTANRTLAPPDATASEEGDIKVFTVVSGGERMGLPISCVQTIFRIGKVTSVPRASREIVGLINLRGKINTATSLRRILGMPDEKSYDNALAICIEHHDEQFALIVDEIGDVISVPSSFRIQEPPNVDPKRAAVTSGVFRLENEILPVLNIDALLDFDHGSPRVARTSRHDGVPA